jgi:hypothetical protein
MISWRNEMKKTWEEIMDPFEDPFYNPEEHPLYKMEYRVYITEAVKELCSIWQCFWITSVISSWYPTYHKSFTCHGDYHHFHLKVKHFREPTKEEVQKANNGYILLNDLRKKYILTGGDLLKDMGGVRTQTKTGPKTIIDLSIKPHGIVEIWDYYEKKRIVFQDLEKPGCQGIYTSDLHLYVALGLVQSDPAAVLVTFPQNYK